MTDGRGGVYFGYKVILKSNPANSELFSPVIFKFQVCSANVSQLLLQIRFSPPMPMSSRSPMSDVIFSIEIMHAAVFIRYLRCVERFALYYLSTYFLTMNAGILRGIIIIATLWVRVSSIAINNTDIVFGVVARTYNNTNVYASSLTWMKCTVSTHVYYTENELNGVDFVRVLSDLKSKFPDKPWYVVIDDDAFVNVDNLLTLLHEPNQRKVYMGAHHCSGPNFQCRTGKIKDIYGGWVNGGAGMVFSNALVTSMDLDTCINHYTNNWNYSPPAADVVVACCVADNWPTGRITHHQGFYYEKQKHHCECKEFGCTGMSDAKDDISYHHLNAFEIMKYYAAPAQHKETCPDSDTHVVKHIKLI